MDLSSWFRRTLMKNNKSNQTPSPTNRVPSESHNKKQLDEEEELGVTEQLDSFVKSFTLETFKSFPLHDDQLTSTSTTTSNGSALNSAANIQKDLNEWQERHATLVLTKIKEISQLRYVLCPRHLKERQFWSIYFALVKSYVTPYEIRAIQKSKLRRIGKKDEKSLDSGYEVEMAETKGTMCTPPSP